MLLKPVGAAQVVPLLILGLPGAPGAQPPDGPPARRPGLGREVVVEEVRFRHGTYALAGSLYRPALPGRHPAVALVLGSGAQDRAYGGVGPPWGSTSPGAA
jgi:hypothetical protein